uniref:Putative biotin protein ligase n=1 Tax=Ornithodoros turicata TaxID=34597 RepID=A0A2R5L9D8_9ACAR
MLLYTIRRIASRSSSYFLLPLRGVTASVGGSGLKEFLNHADMPHSKPPNVLVFTGEDPSCPHPLYNAVKQTLDMCVNPDTYTVYMLSERQINTTPWLQNTRVLIVACTEPSYTASRIFLEYYLRGGRLLVVSSKIRFPGIRFEEPLSELQPVTVRCRNFTSASIMHGRIRYGLDDNVRGTSLAEDDRGQPVLYEVRCNSSKGVLILSQVHLEVDPLYFSTSEATFSKLKQSNEARISMLRYLLSTRLKVNCEPKPSYSLTVGHLFAATQAELSSLLLEIQSHCKNNEIVTEGTTFRYVLTDPITDVRATECFLPICASPTNQMRHISSFNHQAYFDMLQTTSLGRAVLFVENATTTMQTIKGLQNAHGSLAVATRQLQGKGRSGNAWLGPAGCAMFTVCVHISLRSLLGSRSSFIQHLAALAITKAVRSAKGYELVNVRIKWPNDIYYGSHSKIGGILVSSTLNRNEMCCYIGCGINVSNSQPTVCINDVAKVVAENRHMPAPQQLLPEEVIARTLNELELLIAHFQSGQISSVLQDYYRFWLHSGQTVTLQSLGCKAVIKGLDEYGYLVAESMGKEYKLQPDGNSFDLMNNLIIMKPT